MMSLSMIRSFTRLAAMKISYRKDYFLRVFRKWKQDLPNTGANSGSYCHTFHHIRPILRRGSNSGLNSQFVAQRERIQKSWLVKSWHSLFHHGQVLPQGYCPSLVYRGVGWRYLKICGSSNRRVSTIPALLVQQKDQKLEYTLVQADSRCLFK